MIEFMYVCICNAITDKQIRKAAKSGAQSLWDLQRKLGIASGCGSCKEPYCSDHCHLIDSPDFRVGSALDETHDLVHPPVRSSSVPRGTDPDGSFRLVLVGTYKGEDSRNGLFRYCKEHVKELFRRAPKQTHLCKSM